MTDDLRSTINDSEIEREILTHAQDDDLGERLTADYEHGQWWVTDLDSGAQWSVVDCESVDGDEYFGFEQVSQGDEL